MCIVYIFLSQIRQLLENHGYGTCTFPIRRRLRDNRRTLFHISTALSIVSNRRYLFGVRLAADQILPFKQQHIFLRDLQVN